MLVLVLSRLTVYDIPNKGFVYVNGYECVSLLNVLRTCSDYLPPTERHRQHLLHDSKQSLSLQQICFFIYCISLNLLSTVVFIIAVCIFLRHKNQTIGLLLTKRLIKACRVFLFILVIPTLKFNSRTLKWLYSVYNVKAFEIGHLFESLFCISSMLIQVESLGFFLIVFSLFIVSWLHPTRLLNSRCISLQNEVTLLEKYLFYQSEIW